MQAINIFNAVISILFLLCYSYQMFYIPVALFIKNRKHTKAKNNRYAVLISARNEEKVIGNLLDSLKSQTYDKRYFDIFVIADNCTDSTADIAREKGAYVYERFNKVQVGKGYALDALLTHIHTDHKDKNYDGFFIFDADNVLEENYIYEMNKVFSDGYEIVTGYRNSKNYGDNWISAGNALWFLRESRYLNGARMKIGSASMVGGTGFMFSKRVIKECGGWKFFTLTEDLEFTAHNIIKGVKCGYCPNAVLYDEQPVKFSQSWKQRMRWSKGYLQVTGKYGGRLIKNIFRRGFSCYDLLMGITPAYILTFVSVIFNTAAFAGMVISGKDVIPMVLSSLSSFGNMCLTMFIVGAITTVTEWKRIQCSSAKKIFYAFTFPFFMLTYIPVSFAAVFSKVQWSPIEHTVSVNAKQIKARGRIKQKD